jgi:hypothetical protein
MGQELSCPCDCSHKVELTEEKPKLDIDITETLLQGKLLEKEIIFERIYGDWKVLIIKTNDLIRFFNTKKLRLIYNKKEIFYYYSTVYLTNFLSNELSFIILKHIKGEEDKSSRNLDSRSSFKRKSISLEDKSIFKVENLNLVSNDKHKIKQHILADLNKNLSKDYIFVGIVADSDDGVISPAYNTSLIDIKSSTQSAPIKSNRSLRNFQLVYKRVFMRSLLKCVYDVEIFDGLLNETNIKKIILSDKYKKMMLKAIIFDAYEPNKNVYYFIFCKNEAYPDDIVDYTIIQMDKGKDKDMMFAEDIARKLEFIQDKFNLACVVTDYYRKKCYFIMVDLDFEFETETSKEFILQNGEYD